MIKKINNYIAFADESGQNHGKYRSVSLVVLHETDFNHINDYYYKLKRDGIIDDYQIGLEHKFRNYLKSEDLLNNTN